MGSMSGFDRVRIDAPLFWCEGDGEPPASARALECVPIDRRLARDLNALWHSRLPIYDTGFCLNSLASFGAKYANVWYAAAIWTNPVAANLPQHTWLELRRFAVAPDAPRYTATRVLSLMRRHIARAMPHVEVLVSYQDCEAHAGTIYRADNWTATARHGGGSWDRPGAVNRSNGRPRRRPDRNGATGPKQRWEYRLKGGEGPPG